MRAQSPATFLIYRTEATGETQNIKPHLSHRINLEEVAACSCKCGQLIEMLQEKPVCLLTDTKDHGWSWSGQIKSIPKKAKVVATEEAGFMWTDLMLRKKWFMCSWMWTIYTYTHTTIVKICSLTTWRQHDLNFNKYYSIVVSCAWWICSKQIKFRTFGNSTRHKSTHYLIFICMFDRANIFLKGHQSEKWPKLKFSNAVLKMSNALTWSKQSVGTWISTLEKKHRYINLL